MLTKGRIKYFLMFSLLGALFIAVLKGITVLYPDTLIALKFIGMWTGETSLSGGRIDVLEHFQFGELNPLLGTGFYDWGIFGSPHNQYIELDYRAGSLS